MRVPTPVELTCADPARRARCRTSSSPTRRCCRWSRRLTKSACAARRDAESYYSVAAYRTELANDIQFISAGSGAVNAGYFQNVGSTRRQGVELGGGRAVRPVPSRGATAARRDVPDRVHREQPEQFDRQCRRHDRGAARATRLPGIPRHLLKLRGEWTMRAGARCRRDRGRRKQPVRARRREQSRIRAASVPGYVVVNLDARWDVDRALGDLREHRQPVRPRVTRISACWGRITFAARTTPSRPRSRDRKRSARRRRHSAYGSALRTISACGAADGE